MMTEQLISKFPIISDQIEANELRVILSELEKVLDNNTAGDIVEFGCYVGTTSLFMHRMLIAKADKHDRTLHVYDSFQGLPEKKQQDISPMGEQFQAGKLSASKATLIKNFRRAKLPLPIIHKAWFDELTDTDLPSSIAFAFLDGDYYESILVPLRLIWPKLTQGAVIIVDDYHNQALPGAAKAVNEWLLIHKLQIHKVQTSLAIIRI